MYKLILAFLMLVMGSCQVGAFGCMATFNTEGIQCPDNRLFEINFLTGWDTGANSDSLDIFMSFYDIS